MYEHLEYFPFGETWVQEHSNTLRTPYLFTGKEFDQETGLYYFGARYYDPRTSVWQSADPILGKYLPSGDNDQNLAGMGGVFNPRNTNLYIYSHLNPLNVTDPDGKEAFKLFGAGERSYYFVIQNSSEGGLKTGFSSISNFSKSPGIDERHQGYDAKIVDEASKYSNVTPDEMKALMLSESGGADKKSKGAFASDPMQVLVPGDFTPDKGKALGITRNETATSDKSIEAGTKWYSKKKDDDYSWRLSNPGGQIPPNSKQGQLLRDPKLSGDPVRGFMGYKGWQDSQVKGAERALKIYEDR